MDREKLNLQNLSKGYCLFCFVNWEKNQTEVKCLLPPTLTSTCSVLLKVICSILDINLEEIFKPVLHRTKLSSVEKTEVEVKLCQNCENNTKKLKELYRESERCERDIKGCLEALKNTPMEENEQDRLWEEFEEEMWGDLSRLLYSNAMNILKSQIAQKCGVFEPAKPNQNVPEAAPESTERLRTPEPPRTKSKPFKKPRGPRRSLHLPKTVKSKKNKKFKSSSIKNTRSHKDPVKLQALTIHPITSWRQNRNWTLAHQILRRNRKQNLKRAPIASKHFTLYPGNKLRCLKCDQFVNSASAAYIHFRFTHGKGKFHRCRGCGKNNFRFPSQLRTHLRSCLTRARDLFYDRVNIKRRARKTGSHHSSKKRSGLKQEKSKAENGTPSLPPPTFAVKVENVPED